MKFLIDVGVGKKVENWLRENGYDVLAVRDIDERAKDSKILQFAFETQRMIITMDKDFGELVFNSGKTHAGVLILRLEDADGDQKAAVIKSILQNYEKQLKSAFCVYQDGKLRIKD
ncbi:MAG: DUF5615 family PIN-like protein [Smithella sp.]